MIEVKVTNRDKLAALAWAFGLSALFTLIVILIHDSSQRQIEQTNAKTMHEIREKIKQLESSINEDRQRWGQELERLNRGLRVPPVDTPQSKKGP